MFDLYASWLGDHHFPQAMRGTVNPKNVEPMPVFLNKAIVQNPTVKLPKNKKIELADLLEKIFVVDPLMRISAEEAVRHPFFHSPI